MAYREEDRRQTQLFPQSLDEYISGDDPVRAYDAFVDALDLGGLGITLNAHQVGDPQYHPRAMLKLLVYGYSYGVRSSRKLEQAAHHNLSFIWLLGGLKPDYHTIARFRAGHKEALKNLLKQCARLCVKLGLIEGNTLFVDGSKMRAAASIKHTWTPQRCERHLKKIDARVESILAECARVDEQEQGRPSLVKLTDELKDQETLQAKIKNVLQELQTTGAPSRNTTDPDCVKVKGRQGTHAGYNAQIVADEKYGLIVSNDVVNESNDVGQFANQIEQAHAALGRPAARRLWAAGRKCVNACGDAGYANTAELKKIDGQDVTVIVPSVKQAHDKTPSHSTKAGFSTTRTRAVIPAPKETRCLTAPLTRTSGTGFIRSKPHPYAGPARTLAFAQRPKPAGASGGW